MATTFPFAFRPFPPVAEESYEAIMRTMMDPPTQDGIENWSPLGMDSIYGSGLGMGDYDLGYSAVGGGSSVDTGFLNTNAKYALGYSTGSVDTRFISTSTNAANPKTQTNPPWGNVSAKQVSTLPPTTPLQLPVMGREVEAGINAVAAAAVQAAEAAVVLPTETDSPADGKQTLVVYHYHYMYFNTPPPTGDKTPPPPRPPPPPQQQQQELPPPTSSILKPERAASASPVPASSSSTSPTNPPPPPSKSDVDNHPCTFPPSTVTPPTPTPPSPPPIRRPRPTPVQRAALHHLVHHLGCASRSAVTRDQIARYWLPSAPRGLSLEQVVAYVVREGRATYRSQNTKGKARLKWLRWCSEVEVEGVEEGEIQGLGSGMEIEGMEEGDEGEGEMEGEE